MSPLKGLVLAAAAALAMATAAPSEAEAQPLRRAVRASVRAPFVASRAAVRAPAIATRGAGRAPVAAAQVAAPPYYAYRPAYNYGYAPAYSYGPSARYGNGYAPPYRYGSAPTDSDSHSDRQVPASSSGYATPSESAAPQADGDASLHRDSEPELVDPPTEATPDVDVGRRVLRSF